MNKTPLLFLIILATSFCSEGLCQQTFYNSLKTGGLQYYSNLRQASNGDYFSTTGSDSGLYISRTDSAGKILWQKIYGKSAKSYTLISNADNNGFVAAGITLNNKLNKPSPSIIKCDNNGDIIWAKSFEFTNVDDFAYPAAILTNSKGNYVIITIIASDKTVIRITEFDRLGNVVGNIGYSNFNSFIYQSFSISMFEETSNGNYLIGINYASAIVEGLPSGYLLMIDKKGNIISYKSASPVFTSFDNADHAISTFNNKGKTFLLGYYSQFNGSRSNYYYIVEINKRIKSGTAKLVPYYNFALQRYFKEIGYAGYLNTGSIINRHSVVSFSGELKKFDSLGRVCPGYDLPEYSYDTGSVEFYYGDEINTIKKINDVVSLTDGGIDQKAVGYMKQICSGEGPQQVIQGYKGQRISRPLPLTISPNPVTSVVNISVAAISTKNARIEFFTADGRLVKTVTLNSEKNPITINVSQFQKGFYIIKILVSGQIQTVKFIKQ